MKLIFKILVIFILVTNSACSQDITQRLKGQWSLSPEYDEADVIILRSNNTYLVYNELDYEGINPEKYDYNIFFDDSLIRTARVETGNWIYDEASKQITLADRNFIKENSEFNSHHGKREKLVFRVKEVTDKKLVLCSIEKENSCDTYLRNTNFTKDEDKVFYREITEEYSGTGTQVKEILLSGYEMELKLSYDFYKEPDQLVIEDRSGKELFSTDMIATHGRKTAEISLRGVTKLVLKVKSEQASSKWQFKVEIK